MIRQIAFDCQPEKPCSRMDGPIAFLTTNMSSRLEVDSTIFPNRVMIQSNDSRTSRTSFSFFVLNYYKVLAISS